MGDGTVVGTSSCESASSTTSTSAQRETDAPSGRRRGGRGNPLNLVAREEGSKAEKERWWASEGPVIEAEIEADPKRAKAIIIRFYKAYLRRGRREFRFAPAPEEPQRKWPGKEEGLRLMQMLKGHEI